jgi:hypothetical protein
MTAEAELAWTTWMGSWFAVHWTPEDLPGLELCVLLYDQVRRAIADPFVESENGRGRIEYVRRPSPTTDMRQLLDAYGITPKGQQDRRWLRPEATTTAQPSAVLPTRKRAQPRIRLLSS